MARAGACEDGRIHRCGTSFIGGWLVEVVGVGVESQVGIGRCGRARGSGLGECGVGG